MKTGIYAIIHRDSGKFYIGSAVNMSSRWTDHRKCLRRGNHDNQKLQRAWNKYGEAAFDFAALLMCEKGDLILREQEAINTLDPFYNILRAAGSSLGYKHTEATRAKLSELRKGKPGPTHSVAARQKMRDVNLGRAFSPEHLARLSAAHKGTTASEETRRLMSLAHKGHKHSQEAREKMGRVKRERAVERRANGTIHRPGEAQRAFLSALTGARPRDAKGRLLKAPQQVVSGQHEPLTITQE